LSDVPVVSETAGEKKTFVNGCFLETKEEARGKRSNKD